MSDKAKLHIGKILVVITLLLVIVVIIQTFGDAADGELGAQSRRLRQIPGINVPVPEGPSSSWGWQCKIHCDCGPNFNGQLDIYVSPEDWNRRDGLHNALRRSCYSAMTANGPIVSRLRTCSPSVVKCDPTDPSPSSPPPVFKSGPNQPDDTTPEPVLKSEPEPTPTPAPTQRPWWYFRWRYR